MLPQEVEELNSLLEKKIADITADLSVSFSDNKEVRERRLYKIIFEDGQVVDIGDIGNLVDQYKFRCKLADHAKILLPRFKTEKWDKIAEAMLLHQRNNESMSTTS